MARLLRTFAIRSAVKCIPRKTRPSPVALRRGIWNGFRDGRIRKQRALLDSPGVAPPIQASPEAPCAWPTVFLRNDLIGTAAFQQDYMEYLQVKILWFNGYREISALCACKTEKNHRSLSTHQSNGAEHDIVSKQDIEESARVLGASSQASTGRARAIGARA